MFRNLRFYRITNPWPKTEQKLSEVLSENAFSPCGAFSERSAGWEAPAIYDDATLCRRLHGADLLRLRTHSRVLPVAAIKEALEEKCIGIIDRLFRRSQQPAMTQFPHHSQTRPWTERVTNWFWFLLSGCSAMGRKQLFSVREFQHC